MLEEQLPTVEVPVTEPENKTPQEPVVPPVQPEPTPQPKADEPAVPVAGQPSVIELISSTDSATLLKSEVIQGLLENVRQQEKNKLYKTISERDNTINQLKETISDLQNQLKTKEDMSMEGEKVLLEQIQALKESHDNMMKEMEQEREKARLAKLESYKASKIAEAQGEIVAGMVRGTTEEEIDASIEVAKAEYQKIVSPLKQQVEELGKPQRENAPKPSNPSTPNQMEFTAEQIKAMSPSEYAQYRETLLKNIKG